MIKWIYFFLFFQATILFASIPYQVEYRGISNPAALKTIKTTTSLNTLQSNPPDSLSALYYRAQSDVPDILKILRAEGYYEASVTIDIEQQDQQALVLLHVHCGPVYRIKSFTMTVFEKSQEQPLSCPFLSSPFLGMKEGDPLLAQNVMNAELKALEKLSSCGYPLASIKDRSVLIDGDTKMADVHFTIISGPLCHFGSLSLEGNTKVKPLFFERSLDWKQGEVYSAQKVEETQKALMDSGLFSSILISHEDTPSEEGELPMRIEVAESKHRSIYAGVSYQTYYGPGVTFGWEHRNLGGTGQRFSLQGDLTKRSHTGVATYLIPNFLQAGQDYVWEAEAMHLNILPFSQRGYSLTNRFEKKYSKRSRVAFGVEGERFFVNSSVLDGDYWQLSLPVFFIYNGSNDLLNPTTGFQVKLQETPSFVLSPELRSYLSNELTVCYYLPLTNSHAVTLAQKLFAGAILCKGDQTVPVPYRFFGGSEEDLRGYAYYSVSPLNQENKPIGGRSAVYYTLETRFRMTKTVGVVPFFDLGRVTKHQLPSLQGKWLKSVGLGLRYFSFMGPFRLDVGFPLNPRKGLDKNYRLLVSIGQTF